MGNKENQYVIRFKSPITFEEKQYGELDMSCLKDINAADMIAVSRLLSNSGNSNVNQEFTLEYALNLAARALCLPVEFFNQLKPRQAMQVKSCVNSFLFGQE